MGDLVGLLRLVRFSFILVEYQFYYLPKSMLRSHSTITWSSREGQNQGSCDNIQFCPKKPYKFRDKGRGVKNPDFCDTSFLNDPLFLPFSERCLHVIRAFMLSFFHFNQSIASKIPWKICYPLKSSKEFNFNECQKFSV